MIKVLVIEDNPDVLDNVKEILELSGYDVNTAVNGREGVRIAVETLPELIVCDIMMPEMDGYGVLKILRQNPKTTGIPFIYLTAKADKADLRAGMNLGADDYITKPFTESELVDAVKMRLSRNASINQDLAKAEGLDDFIEQARGLETLQNLPNNRKVVKLQKKDSLYREGDVAHTAYYVHKGVVKCSKSDEYGKELVTHLYTAGEFFGYIDFLEGAERMESSSALEDAEVAVIPKDDFMDLLHKNHDVANRFIKMIAGDVLQKEERLLRLAYSPVRERVADALYILTQRVANPDAEYPSLRVSREDLAAIAGTATESLIRTLADFKEEKLIESHGREIRILNLEKLAQLSGRR